MREDARKQTAQVDALTEQVMLSYMLIEDEKARTEVARKERVRGVLVCALRVCRFSAG